MKHDDTMEIIGKPVLNPHNGFQRKLNFRDLWKISFWLIRLFAREYTNKLFSIELKIPS